MKECEYFHEGYAYEDGVPNCSFEKGYKNCLYCGTTGIKQEVKVTSSEVSKIINNPILKSNRVIRYSGIYQAEQEALSEHILSVEYISYFIASDLIELGDPIDLGILLEKALFHDADEPLTGDIPRPTKYATPESKELLDQIAELSLQKLPKVTQRIIEVWKSAKDFSKEGLIIRISDFLDVYKKILLEIKRLNNYEFDSVALEFMEYYSSIDWTSMIEGIFTQQNSQDYLKQIIKEIENGLFLLVQSDSFKEKGMTLNRV